MIDSADATDYFLDQLNIRRGLRPKVHAHLLTFFADNLDGWDLAEYAKRHTTPALIFHDAEDPRLPHGASVQTAENWANCSMVTTHGLGHHQIRKDEVVVGQIAAFLSTGERPNQ